MTQYDAVVETLERLGGYATLGRLNKEVFEIKECVWKTKSPFASIRRIVQTDNRIYKIKPGLWALKSHQKELEQKGIIVETEKNRNSKEVIEFNHTYYQGLLLTIGNIKGFGTYAPSQDKNRKFASGVLDDLRTIHIIPNFSYNKFIERSSSIDVIWFNSRNMPDSFFEVEHSTDIYNSLGKYVDLQDFYTKMYIVADQKRKYEFEKKINSVSYDKIRKDHRVIFLSYDDLEKQYNQVVELQSVQTVIL